MVILYQFIQERGIVLNLLEDGSLFFYYPQVVGVVVVARACHIILRRNIFHKSQILFISVIKNIFIID